MLKDLNLSLRKTIGKASSKVPGLFYDLLHFRIHQQSSLLKLLQKTETPHDAHDKCKLKSENKSRAISFLKGKLIALLINKSRANKTAKFENPE